MRLAEPFRYASHAPSLLALRRLKSVRHCIKALRYPISLRAPLAKAMTRSGGYASGSVMSLAARPSAMAARRPLQPRRPCRRREVFAEHSTDLVEHELAPLVHVRTNDRRCPVGRQQHESPDRRLFMDRLRKSRRPGDQRILGSTLGRAGRHRRSESSECSLLLPLEQRHQQLLTITEGVVDDRLGDVDASRDRLHRRGGSSRPRR